MKKEKVSFVVEKIVSEPTPNGPKRLKIFIRSNGKQYIKLVRKMDYLDEGSRLGIHRLWIKGLKDQMTEDDTSGGKKETDAKLLVDMVGCEIEDEED